MSHILMPAPPASGTSPSRRTAAPFPAGRFLSREECPVLLARAQALALGGGLTRLVVESHWEANLRWARNQVISGGDIRRNTVGVLRDINGARPQLQTTNRFDDAGLTFAIRHAERALTSFWQENVEADREHPFREPYTEPKLWSDATYNQTAEQRAELMHRLVEPAIKAGLLSAGYVQVSAHGRAALASDATAGEPLRYFPYTLAQCSVTVRTPDGSGSGWAGVDHHDWSTVDPAHLAQTALEKCQMSRNPVRIEPGRYTAILEPQAVADLCRHLFGEIGLDRLTAEWGDRQVPDATAHTATYDHYATQASDAKPAHVFGKGNGISKLGERVIDERLSVSMDPTDPACAFPPFEGWQVYHPVTWIEDGVLRALSYNRAYAITKLGLNTGGLPTTGAFHMRAKPGTETTVEEMIATTKRGVLVTRFWGVDPPLETRPMMLTGYTRDGLWLVEDGKISKAVRNFRFRESPFNVLNNVEQVGTPRRVFHPTAEGMASNTGMGYAPIVVPALKVRDFNFTSLTDAI